MSQGILGRVVSTLRSDGDSGGDPGGEAADPARTHLYECPDCGTVYVASELESCSDCGTDVDRIPSERDLGFRRG
jgi:DNA-directed RNA polymerase subunit RPC12/RpoP